MEESDVVRENKAYLLRIGSLVSRLCPEASRYYMFSREKYASGDPELLKDKKHCSHCGSIWCEKKFRVRVYPHAATKHLKKLLCMDEKMPWKLNTRQKKKLKKWHESANKIVYYCAVCRRKTVYPGSKKRLRNQCSSHITKTPASNKKLKKLDLNAGLFISPLNNKRSTSGETSNVCEQKQESEILLSNDTADGKEVKTPVVLKLFSNSLSRSGSKSSLKNVAAPAKLKTQEFTTITEGQSSGKKKKKTLLSQILNQEQSSKKKTSLASFLVSL